MKKQKLVEYVILWHPQKTETKEKSKIIVPRTELLVNEEKDAFILANRAIPEEYIDQLDQVEVILRPF